MKHILLVGALVGLLGVGGASAQTAKATSLGTVRLTMAVLADGQPLPAGTYQVRVSDDAVKPAVGMDPAASRWVEFVKGGKVAGREVASVIGKDDIGKIAKGAHPKGNGASVELLVGGDYLRVWIAHGNEHYLINMPPAKKAAAPAGK